MNHYARYNTFLQLLLREKTDSMWQADLAEPVSIQAFRVHNFSSSPELILRQCNLSFAQRCGCGSARELIGRAVNHFIFAHQMSDVSVFDDIQGRPYVVKFRSLEGSNGAPGNGYSNTVELITDETRIHSMLGCQCDISPQLRRHAEQQALKAKLTVKEFGIFLSLARGHTVKHIASEAGSSEKAVYFHIGNMQRKLKVQGIAGLVQKAYRLGCLDSTII
jgi:DNA-binding CsgD family transcriptional regulator